LNRNAGVKIALLKTLAIGGAVRFETGGLKGGGLPADNGPLDTLRYAPVKKIRAGLYFTTGFALNDRMSLGELVVITLGCMLLVVTISKFATKFFSDDAKRERRRRRNHAPLSAKSNRPMVKFSVKTKKDRRK